jgi:hypothetical protein
VEFPPEILDNVQFTNVFQEVWRNVSVQEPRNLAV